MASNPLLTTRSLGQSLWLDDLQRPMLLNGELDRLIREDGLAGMTSNPSIFEKEIVERHAYDETIKEQTQAGLDAAQIYEGFALDSVRQAADHFAGTYAESDGRDGYVSLEVSPELAYDTQATLTEARRLWQALERPNVMIKVPATEAGLDAIEQLISEGINVNVTLLFGLERYREVARRFLTGLERRQQAGESIKGIASVASFFLSRIDSQIDQLLDSHLIGRGQQAPLARRLRGETAIASARLAYRDYQSLFAGPRWAALKQAGAQPQRLLWASTSTKDPAYRDVMYVEALIGPETVNTLPLSTYQAFRDHGRAAARLEDALDRAEDVIASLPHLDINLDTITQRLETEGVQKFQAAFRKLMTSIEQHRLDVAAGQ